MEVLVIYLIFVGGIAWWASSWGRNVAVWTLIALLLSPLLAAIGLLIKGRARADTDPVAALTQLADLRDRGIITTEEFEAKKTGLMKRV